MPLPIRAEERLTLAMDTVCPGRNYPSGQANGSGTTTSKDERLCDLAREGSTRGVPPVRPIYPAATNRGVALDAYYHRSCNNRSIRYDYVSDEWYNRSINSGMGTKARGSGAAGDAYSVYKRI